MALPAIPTAAAVAVVLALLYKYIVVPALLSPLAHVPAAHWSAHISPLWILYQRQQQRDTYAVHAAHAARGPLVRLAPNELSVNSVAGGIRTVYAGGFEKGAWYRNAFTNYGVEPMFAMGPHAAHARRKRMLSNVYAKTTLQGSAALARSTRVLVGERLVPALRRRARSGGEPVEMYDVLSAVVMDFVAAYVFGLRSGSDLIRKPDEAAKFFRDYKARQRYTFWPQELPRLTAAAFAVGLGGLLVPRWVTDSNHDIEDWLADMCARAEATLAEPEGTVAVEDTPTVYAQLRNALVKDAAAESSGGAAKGADDAAAIAAAVEAHRRDIASELLDHTLAGFDTSGITLTWLAWELSKPCYAEWQARLRAEIRGESSGGEPVDMSGHDDAGSSSLDYLDAKRLDALPVLHAVLMETLRVHTAIPGNQPRVTPAGGLTMLGDPASGGVTVTKVPAGVRVQAQAYSLHRNPQVFPDPDTWDPARWLDADEAQKREMARWFWAFGSGGRMCVGSNLAMLDMKATVAAVWGNFATENVDDEGMVHNGGYIAEPLGAEPTGTKAGSGEGKRFLLLRLTEIDTEKTSVGSSRAQ